MKTIRVNVTFDHIAIGERADCRRCPVALAVGRHFPGASDIIAGPNRIDVMFDKCIVEADGTKLRMYRALTPPQVFRFMEDFDADREVSTNFSFDLVFYPHADHTPPPRTVL